MPRKKEKVLHYVVISKRKDHFIKSEIIEKIIIIPDFFSIKKVGISLDTKLAQRKKHTMVVKS